MFARLLPAPLAVFILAASLWLWRETYVITDWALAWLIPLGVLLLLAQVAMLREDYRARMGLMLQPGSRLSRILTGRMSSLAGALGFVALSLPVLAWQALNLTPPEAGMVAALCVISGWVFLLIERQLAGSFREPFARAYAMRLASWLCAALACPVLLWSSWRFTQYPDAFVSAGFQEAMQLGMAQMPERRGMLAEIMAPLYAIQGAKMWFVVQHRDHGWLTLWPALDAALFGFVATRASILLSDLAEHLLARQASEPVEDAA